MRRYAAKQYFLPGTLPSDSLSINAIGIGETMPACLVDRPSGTKDYLIMVFADPVRIGPSEACQWPANTMMIWEPGATQQYGNQQSAWRHSWMHCAGARIDEIAATTQVPLNRPFRISRPQAVEHYLWDAYLEMTEQSEPHPDVIGNAVHSCLLDVRRQITGDRLAIPGEFTQLKRYLGENLQERHSLAEMAERLNMSRSHFCSEFRRYLGVSPIEYVIRLRLQAAMNLLRDQERTIGQIALEVGYDDPFLFSRQFKARFHISPREMRKRDGTALSSGGDG